jgi:fructokinase
MNDVLNVIGIGELLWDVFPGGKKLGGAPCNFVYHAQRQGASGILLSAVGDDNHGMEILKVLKKKKISEELIQINDKPTGTVDVVLSAEGIPDYTIHENVAWDFIFLNDATEKAVAQADIICFGTLAQRNSISRNTLEKLLGACRPETLVVYDINLRQQYYNRELIHRSLQFCNVLKLNEEELSIVRDLLGLVSEVEESHIRELLEVYSLRMVALTKGAEGSMLVTPDDRSYLRTPEVQVKDTVGAGDAFAAVMSTGFAKGQTLQELHQRAVDISAFVCTREGAMPDYREFRI